MKNLSLLLFVFMTVACEDHSKDNRLFSHLSPLDDVQQLPDDGVPQKTTSEAMGSDLVLQTAQPRCQNDILFETIIERTQKRQKDFELDLNFLETQMACIEVIAKDISKIKAFVNEIPIWIDSDFNTGHFQKVDEMQKLTKPFLMVRPKNILKIHIKGHQRIEIKIKSILFETKQISTPFLVEPKSP